MPNRSRRHLGLYYLVLKGSIGKGIESADKGYPDFLDLLLTVLTGTGYRLYAFCLLPGQVHLAVQMSHVPLADFTQRLATKYDEWVRRRYGRSADLQEMREPRLFDREDRVRELIRFIHLLPLKLGRDPQVYHWSGQRTYLGRTRTMCVDSRAGLQLFGRQRLEARQSYEKYFKEGLEAVAAEQTVGSTATSRKERLPLIAQASEDNRAIESLDDLIARISDLGNRQVGDVRSCSRERLCSLLRALVMWHATRLELAPAIEVAQYLHRDPSSLYSAVKRYSVLYPNLFSRPGDFQDLNKLSSERSIGWSMGVHPIPSGRSAPADYTTPN